MIYAYYETPGEFVDSATTLRDRRNKLNQLYDALLTTLLNNSHKAGIQEIQINDGQSIVKATYRNPSEIQTAMDNITKQINIIDHRLKGRLRRLQ